MRPLWKLLKFTPPSVMNLVKKITNDRFRLWVREHLGGSCKTIPDKNVTVADGRQFHIGPDYIYWPLYLRLDFEPEATSLLRQIVQSGDTIVDVGANYGWYTTLFAQLVGSTGHVHAFEPVPSTLERLTEHIELNRYRDRVTVNRSAVGEDTGEISIHVFDHLSHSRSSLSRLDQEQFTSFSAPITDLDTYLAKHDTEKVDFLKCDVEGSELMVLKGARQLLLSIDAPVILVELNDETSEAFGYATSDIWSYLQEVGYDHFYGIEMAVQIRRVTTQEEIAKLPLLLCAKGDRIMERIAGSTAIKNAA